MKGVFPLGETQPVLSPSAGRSGAISTALGGLVAIAAAIGIGRFVYTPILPPMIESLGLTKSQAGLIASANFLGYLVSAVLAAMPRLAGSRRLWLLGSLPASAATTAAMGLTRTLAAFLVLRSLGGAASGADRARADGSARPHNRRAAPRHRAHDCLLRSRPDRRPALRRDTIGSPWQLYHTLDCCGARPRCRCATAAV
jgi:hypothetical protein